MQKQRSVCPGPAANSNVKHLLHRGPYAGDPIATAFTINLASPKETVEAWAREMLK